MSHVVPEEERLSVEEISSLPVLRNANDALEIRASGVAVMNDGQLARHKFFQSIAADFDDYSDIAFTPEEARRVKGHLAVFKTGASAALPRICQGESCSLAAAGRCIIWDQGNAPLLRSCLIESNLLRDWRMQHFDEYGVDINNPSEVRFINELAEIELKIWRINNALAGPEHADLLIDNPVGVDSEGQPILQKQITPLMDLLDKLNGRKSKVIKSMVGDREGKWKKQAGLKEKDETDPAQAQAELRKLLEKVRREVNNPILEGESRHRAQVEEIPITTKELSPDDILNEVSLGPNDTIDL